MGLDETLEMRADLLAFQHKYKLDAMALVIVRGEHYKLQTLTDGTSASAALLHAMIGSLGQYMTPEKSVEYSERIPEGGEA